MRQPPTRPEYCRIAYFTMEIAIDAAIPTYSGGLGVLAGDTIRSFADLRVPAVAVTLLQRRGYFVQILDPATGQHEEPARWEPAAQLRRLEPTAEVAIEGRPVTIHAWARDVIGIDGGVVTVLLLDTDDPANDPYDRALCGELYGGDARYRLCQEIVLGIGGVRMLEALGYSGLHKYHLNEGHAAFATLELARRAQLELDEVRRRCVFTTHTPVPAGHDQFPRALADRALEGVVPAALLDRIAGGGELLNMTALALNLSGYVNGVAQRHAEVSRAMFPGYGIEHVTNGVHSRTWTAPAFAELFERHLPGWSADPFLLRNAARIPGAEIWAAHEQAKRHLLATIAARTGRSLAPDVLTIGFARRATIYKRADLVFSDLARLRATAACGGRVQLVFAGKAHPRDTAGKELIRRLLGIASELGDEVPVVYLPDYDVPLAQQLVAGVDLWLNTPERPLEASGTSGMKAAHNGVPSFSVLDGWWIEGHVEGVTGWAIGPSGTSALATEASSRDADDLYTKLATVIAPMFYRDREQWVSIMRSTISLNASFFHTQRMAQQYVTDAYL